MPDQVPYLDENGYKRYMSTERYIRNELQKELQVRDDIAAKLADKSEAGLIPRFIKAVNGEQIADTGKKHHRRKTPMQKLSTIQKRHNLNTVFRLGEAGPGGAYHDYGVELIGAKVEDVDADSVMVAVEFQRGPRCSDDARPGVLDVDLLEIVRDRLQCFQAGPYATRENACALTHIEEALLWMNKRTEDRAERAVLGTYME
jgi:hypothetical protein